MDQEVIAATRRWVENLVVGLYLCPFAGREVEAGRVRYVVSRAIREDQLLEDVQAELELLEDDPDVETTLLIHPDVLQDFGDYNRFLDLVEALLRQRDWEGVFQVASFHPDYQFAGTAPDDVENYTNRSPYPLLHLLREESLQRAIAAHGRTEEIPEENIVLMKKLGRAKVEALLRACFNRDAGDSRQIE